MRATVRRQTRYVTWVLVAAAALALPTIVAIRQVDGVLAALHAPRTQSYRASSLTDFGFHLPKAERVQKALETWNLEWKRHHHAGESSPSPFRSPHFVLSTYFLLDFFFILAYAALLAAALVRVDRALSYRARGTATVRVRRAGYRRIVAFALGLVPLLAAVDALEDVASLFNARGVDGEPHAASAAALWVGWSASWAKFAFALLILVPAVVATLEVWRGDTATTGRTLARTVHVVRTHLLIVVVFAVVLVSPIAKDQAADVIRRWTVDWGSGLLAFALMLWFSIVLFASGRWHVVAAQTHIAGNHDNRHDQPSLHLLAAIGALLATLGVALRIDRGSGLGLVIPGAILLVLVALSWLTRDFPVVPHRARPLGGTRAVPALLAALPLVLLGLAVVGASIDEVVYAKHAPFWWVILGGVAMQAVGWGLYCAARLLPDVQDAFSLVLFASAILGAGGVVWIWRSPFAVPDSVGLLGVLALFFVCLTLLAHAATWLSHRVKPLEVFRVVRLDRTPVIAFVLVWALVAGFLAKPGYEDARVVSHAGARTWSLGEAWARWKQTQPAAPGDGSATPVLFVIASGGGIRAGYWADIALRCMLEGEPKREPVESGGPSPCASGPADVDSARARLFVASGISGGSVGLATYAAHVLDDEQPASDWPTTHWERDDGAPALSWLLFADMPSALVLRNGGSDRAEILERSWQRTWHTRGLDRGLRTSWALRTRKHPVPLLLLNGTRVQDGCRFESSVLDLAIRTQGDGSVSRDCRGLGPFERGSPDYTQPLDRADWTFATSQDIAEFLCTGEDVRLSTAALLSARFPVISDSGHLHRSKPCGGDRSVDREANVVDGGYFDTSGASPVVELMATLDKLAAKDPPAGGCYLPVLLQLDNSYAGGSVTKAGHRPWEMLAPAQTLKAARDARENNARQIAALLFSSERAFGANWAGVDRYAHVYPRAHPGSTAPLGWTLSAATRFDLLNELLSKENAAEIEKVRQWLEPGRFKCPPP